MFSLMGNCIGFWCLYAVIALCAGHKKSLIISAVLGCVAGVSTALVGGGIYTLLGTIVGSVLIYYVVALQVKSEQKEKAKQHNKESNQDNVELGDIMPLDDKADEDNDDFASY